MSEREQPQPEKAPAPGTFSGLTGSALMKLIRPNESIDMIQWRVNACSQRCTRGHEREGRIDVDGPALADVMDYLDKLEKAILPNNKVTRGESAKKG